MTLLVYSPIPKVILTSPRGGDSKERYKVAFGAPQDSFMPKVPLIAHLEMHWRYFMSF